MSDGKHTGQSILSNPALSQAIATDHANGLSTTAIARKHGISSATLAKALPALKDAATSLLEPSKATPDPDATKQWQRSQASQLQQIMQGQLDTYTSALASGNVNPNSIPIHYGIFADKRLQHLETAASIAGADEAPLADVLSELVGTAIHAKAQGTVNIQVNVHTGGPEGHRGEGVSGLDQAGN